MAKQTKTLNTVIVESFRAIVKEAGIDVRNIDEEALKQIGILDTRGGRDGARYDSAEIRMLCEATQHLLDKGDSLPLFEHLQRKNPEYGDTVGDDTAFQTMYRTITGQNKTVLGYDHRIKALEERFHSHITTGKMRSLIKKGEVAPLDYMRASSSAAYTEMRYQETAPHREILRRAQDELIKFPFREPKEGAKEVSFDAEREAVLKKLGVRIPSLKAAINGTTAESHFSATDANIRYNMRYFDESLTNKGIERIEKAAKDTYALMTEGFFRTGLGLEVSLPDNPHASAIDIRSISAADRNLLGQVLSFKKGETLADTQTRVSGYGQILASQVLESIGKDIRENTYEVKDIDVLSSQLNVRVVGDDGVYHVDGIFQILKNDLAKKIVADGGTATTSTADFLYSALQASLDPTFIREHYGDFPFQPKPGKITIKQDEEGNEYKEVEYKPLEGVLLYDNNAYRVDLPCRPEELTQDQIDAITTRINNDREGCDTKANFRGVKASDFKFGATVLSETLFEAYSVAKEAEIRNIELGKQKPSYHAVDLFGSTKPALYRDLPLYKTYMAQARETLKAYCLTGPVIVREQKEDPIPPVPPKKEETDERNDGPVWRAIDQTRRLYSKAISNLQEKQEAIDTSNPDYKTTKEFEAYKTQDKFFTSMVESMSTKSTEMLQGIFAAKHAELQPEDAPEGAEEQPTIYGVMSDMFKNVVTARKVKEFEAGTYTPAEGEVLPTKEELFNERFALVGQLISLGGAEQASAILKAPEAPTATHEA